MPRVADRRIRIELLRAAEAVFVEHGLAAARVEDITARAGVSKGAFYLHFASKDDCFQQIVEGFVAKLADIIDPDEERPAPSPESAPAILDRWRRHDLEILEFCWQNRGLLKMLLAGGGGAPYAYLIDEFAERVARQTEAWLRLGVDAGLYRAEIDPSVTAALIAGVYDRLVRGLVKQPKRPDLEAWVRQAMGLFTHGLLADEARRILDREVTLADPPRRRSG